LIGITDRKGRFYSDPPLRIRLGTVIAGVRVGGNDAQAIVAVGRAKTEANVGSRHASGNAMRFDFVASNCAGRDLARLRACGKTTRLKGTRQVEEILATVVLDHHDRLASSAAVAKDLVCHFVDKRVVQPLESRLKRPEWSSHKILPLIQGPSRSERTVSREPWLI